MKRSARRVSAGTKVGRRLMSTPTDLLPVTVKLLSCGAPPMSRAMPMRSQMRKPQTARILAWKNGRRHHSRPLRFGLGARRACCCYGVLNERLLPSEGWRRLNVNKGRAQAYCPAFGSSISAADAVASTTFSILIGSIRQRHKLGRPARHTWCASALDWVSGLGEINRSKERDSNLSLTGRGYPRRRGHSAVRDLGQRR
jgi:hypothetical protein